MSEIRPDDYTPSGPYTVLTVAGEEMEIVDKIDIDGVSVLVTAEDQRYVPSDQNDGTVQPFNPAIHVGGNAATGEAGGKWTESLDATDAADAREALKNDLPADATDAANAEAALEGEITQSPTPPAAEEKPPAQVDKPQKKK